MKNAFILSLALLLASPSLSLATDTGSSSCDDSLPTPTVESSVNEDNIVLSWNKIDHYDLAGYKVVISKNDSSPAYPANGYIAWITDRNITSYTIDNSKAYNGGDFGNYLSGGEDYYFTITAVYNCGTKITGNVLHLNYPGENYQTSSCTDSDSGLDRYTKGTVSGIGNDGKPYSTTDVCVGSDLMEYHCNEYGSTATLKSCEYGCSNGACLSSNNSTSVKPTDTDDSTNNTTSYSNPRDKAYTLYRDHVACGTDKPVNINQVIPLRDDSGRILYGNFRCINRYQEQCINDGSFDTYYKEYCTDKDGKKIIIDQATQSTDIPYPIPEVSVSSSDDGILLSWEKINHDAFTGYKVVISKANKKPQYPDHGYARYITDSNVTSILLDNSSAYVRGDFGGYLKPGEDYYLSITALYGQFKVTGNAVEATYNGPDHKIVEKPKDSLLVYKEKAQELISNDLGAILAELQALRDKVKEQETEIKYLRSLITDVKSVTDEVKNTLNQFITYGVDENTKKLGEGERAAVIYSYKSAFNKLPETEDEVADAIKIANGRWPAETNATAETRAKNEFKKVYLREADMANPNDNAAVTIMAYGLRQKAANRNLESEKQGIKTFQYIYGRTPNSTEDWNIMQAITYSGATR